MKETIEESQRKNFFKRIFPTIDFPYYKQFFENSNVGPASAVVTILLLLIIPLMILQIRTVRHQETMR